MLGALKGAERLVGTTQVQKAVESGDVITVFVAEDAEARVTGKLLQMCGERGLEVVMVPTMKELGIACGISVGAAAAAVVKDTRE